MIDRVKNWYRRTAEPVMCASCRIRPGVWTMDGSLDAVCLPCMPQIALVALVELYEAQGSEVE